MGPAPLHWGEDNLNSVYHELAESPADYVCVGEPACPVRSGLAPGFLQRICDQLRRAGKEVYASSLMLVRDEEQRRAFDDLARRVGRIEINSAAFMDLAKCYPAVAGGSLNVYNSAAARILGRLGIERIVLPCELGLESIVSISRNCGVATEVVAHGHIPIAISHVCHTSRSSGRNTDGCEKLCERYPDGIVLYAEDRPMFRTEGPQTLSAAAYCLLEYLPQLEEAGVRAVRILPQSRHTGSIVRIYRDVLDHHKRSGDALAELEQLSSEGLCNGWLLGKPGWHYE